MSLPKSPGVIVDLMKSNNGQTISFKARGREPFKYLQLEGSLWQFWLCSHRGMKKGHKYEGQKSMKSRKSNEEVEKGQEGRDKSQSWTRQTSGLKWILLGDVSPWQGAVLSLRLLETLLVFLLLFLDLSFNGYWMAPAWRLRPVAHLQIKDTQNDYTVKQQKQAQMHIHLTKTWRKKSTHTLMIGTFFP